MPEEPDPSRGGAGYTIVIFRKHPRDIEREIAVTLFSFENRPAVTGGR
jgi:hypothetical protein